MAVATITFRSSDPRKQGCGGCGDPRLKKFTARGGLRRSPSHNRPPSSCHARINAHRTGWPSLGVDDPPPFCTSLLVRNGGRSSVGLLFWPLRGPLPRRQVPSILGGTSDTA